MIDEPSQNELKAAINNLLWMYGPPRMTLAEAEITAVKWFDDLLAAWKAHRRPEVVPQ